MKKILSCLAVIALAFPTYAQGDEKCPEAAYEAVGRHLGEDIFNAQDGKVVSASCKKWPYRKDILLVSFAYDKGIEDEKTHFVAMLDAKMNVVASYKETIEEGPGNTVGTFTIDTARYDLAPHTRAIGLRFSSSSSAGNALNSASGDWLRLFIQEGKTLRPVFSDYMQYDNALNGLIGYPTGHEFIESGIKTISISKSSTNGYADLIVTDKITYYGIEDDRPPGIKGAARTGTRVYKYDGTRYR